MFLFFIIIIYSFIYLFIYLFIHLFSYYFIVSMFLRRFTGDFFKKKFVIQVHEKHFAVVIYIIQM